MAIYIFKKIKTKLHKNVKFEVCFRKFDYDMIPITRLLHYTTIRTHTRFYSSLTAKQI